MLLQRVRAESPECDPGKGHNCPDTYKNEPFAAVTLHESIVPRDSEPILQAMLTSGVIPWSKDEKFLKKC